MSERITRIDPEGVLSSIRRLVAEEAGGEPLVLTPALRVGPDDSDRLRAVIREELEGPAADRLLDRLRLLIRAEIRAALDARD